MKNRNVVNLRVIKMEVETPEGNLGATGVEMYGDRFREGESTLDYLQRVAGRRDAGGSGLVDVIAQPTDPINPMLIGAGLAPFDAPELDLWVDDEGRYNQPINPVATLFLGRAVYGDVVICTHDREGNTVGLSDYDCSLVVGALERVCEHLQEVFGENEQQIPAELHDVVEAAKGQVMDNLRSECADRVTSNPEVQEELHQAVEGLERYANEGPF